MDDLRGAIHSRQYANQVRDYSGLRYDNMTPMDIDGFMDYHNIGQVFIELKYKDAELPFGQRLGLQHACDNCKKPAVAIVASHETPIEKDIDVANTSVVECYFKGTWRQEKKARKVREVIDGFIKMIESNKR